MSTKKMVVDNAGVKEDVKPIREYLTGCEYRVVSGRKGSVLDNPFLLRLICEAPSGQSLDSYIRATFRGNYTNDLAKCCREAWRIKKYYSEHWDSVINGLVRPAESMAKYVGEKQTKLIDSFYVFGSLSKDIHDLMRQTKWFLGPLECDCIYPGFLNDFTFSVDTGKCISTLDYDGDMDIPDYLLPQYEDMLFNNFPFTIHNSHGRIWNLFYTNDNEYKDLVTDQTNYLVRLKTAFCRKNDSAYSSLIRVAEVIKTVTMDGDIFGYDRLRIVLNPLIYGSEDITIERIIPICYGSVKEGFEHFSVGGRYKGGGLELVLNTEKGTQLTAYLDKLFFPKGPTVMTYRSEMLEYRKKAISALASCLNRFKTRVKPVFLDDIFKLNDLGTLDLLSNFIEEKEV